MDWCFFFYDTALLLRLSRALMPLNEVEALDDDTTILRQHLQDLAFFAGIFTDRDAHAVILPDIDVDSRLCLVRHGAPRR